MTLLLFESIDIAPPFTKNNNSLMETVKIKMIQATQYLRHHKYREEIPSLWQLSKMQLCILLRKELRPIDTAPPDDELLLSINVISDSRRSISPTNDMAPPSLMSE